jgi:tagatose-1,6-bisphosphate aldolase non-catalytic subunit AgaZ/GatZ
LVSQYLPVQYEAIRAGELTRSARELVLHHVSRVPQQYFAACESRAG